MSTSLARQTNTHEIANLLAEMRATNPDSIRLDDLGAFLENEDRCVILVRDESEVAVGMAVLNLVHKLPKIECRIDEVIVTEAARGKGYGKLLIQACEDWAWSKNADVIEFTSRPSREAANALYQSAGYAIRETNVYVKNRIAEV